MKSVRSSGQAEWATSIARAVMHAVLNAQPPDLSELNRAVSPGLDRIVQHCLDKQAERRFQSAHDLRFALEALAPSSSSYSKPAVDPSPAGRVPLFGRLSKGLGRAVAGLLCLAVISLVLQLYSHRLAPDLRVHTLSVLPPDKPLLRNPPWLIPSKAVDNDRDLRRFIKATKPANVPEWLKIPE